VRDARLTGYAKDMRRQMTEPETRLWLQLRAARFGGVKFRRQKVIGRYIADSPPTIRSSWSKWMATRTMSMIP
jgi:very-short-patch-repair endonuclease